MLHVCLIPDQVKLVYSGSVDVLTEPGTYPGLFWDGQHSPLITVERPLEAILIYPHHEVSVTDCAEVQGIVWTTSLTEVHQDKMPKSVHVRETVTALENHGRLAFQAAPGSCYYVDGVLVCCGGSEQL